MDAWEKFILFIVVLQGVWSILEKLRGERPAVAPPEGPSPALEREALASWAAHAVAQLETAKQRVDVLIGGADALSLALSADAGPYAAIRAAVSSTQGALARVAEEIPAILEAVRDAPVEVVVEVASNQDGFSDLFSVVHAADQRLGVLKGIVDGRLRPDRAALLADADSLAGALFAPIRAYADAHDLDLAGGDPVCILADAADESRLIDLFPGHPVVRLPADFSWDVQRWAVVAHALGHTVARSVDGLGWEAEGLIRSDAEPLIPHRVGNRAVYDLQASFARWLPELLADVFAGLMLGPAALRGAVATLQDPDDPDAVITVGVEPDGHTVARHPPAHLRVVLIAALLERVGFIVESEAHLRDWDRLHGAPTEFILPTLMGEPIRVPQRRMLELGRSLVEALYTRSWRSLADAPFSAVNGLEFSPGLWAKAQARVPELLSDTPFEDDPRVVVAAAIEAVGRTPAASLRVARGARRAIVSPAAGERHVPDGHYRRAARADWRLDLADVRDAIALRAAWYRPHGRVPPGRAASPKRPVARG